MILCTKILAAREKTSWTELPRLPGTDGRAGMCAGVSHGTLLCMGGANFPDKRPWNGGTKVWYKDIFLLEGSGQGSRWRKLKDTLPLNLAYGVAVSYKDKIIVTGGNNEAEYSSRTFSLEWKGSEPALETYPSLPQPMACMAGTIVGHLLIVAGGTAVPGGPPLKKCYLLDLQDPVSSWAELPPWPGPGRTIPVSAGYAGRFFLFSGECAITNAAGKEQRHILQDAYSLLPEKRNGKWTGQWTRLADIPRGVAGGPSPVPLIDGRTFLFWGGVDRVTSLYTDPATHPGIPGELLRYYPDSDSWSWTKEEGPGPARVTLPTVDYRGSTYFISGETRPGIRIPSVPGVRKS